MKEQDPLLQQVVSRMASVPMRAVGITRWNQFGLSYDQMDGSLPPDKTHLLGVWGNHIRPSTSPALHVQANQSHPALPLGVLDKKEQVLIKTIKFTIYPI